MLIISLLIKEFTGTKAIKEIGIIFNNKYLILFGKIFIGYCVELNTDIKES